MSKNILFRGQTRKKGEKVTMSGTPIPSNWVFGGIFPQNNGGDFAIIYQQDPEIQKFPVYAETVCQYTGKNDKYGGKIFENDIITYVATVNGVDTPCKGKVFYSDFLATYLVFVYTDLAHSFAQNNKLDPNPGSIPLSSCAHIIVIGNVFDGEYELPDKVKDSHNYANLFSDDYSGNADKETYLKMAQLLYEKLCEMNPETEEEANNSCYIANAQKIAFQRAICGNDNYKSALTYLAEVVQAPMPRASDTQPCFDIFIHYLESPEDWADYAIKMIDKFYIDSKSPAFSTSVGRDAVVIEQMARRYVNRMTKSLLTV